MHLPCSRARGSRVLWAARPDRPCNREAEVLLPLEQTRMPGMAAASAGAKQHWNVGTVVQALMHKEGQAFGACLANQVFIISLLGGC